MDIDQKLLSELVSKGLLSQALADEIKLTALNTGERVENILSSKRIVSSEDLLQIKAGIFHVPYIVLTGRGISPEVLSFIPEPVAKKYKIIPFELDKETGKLLVAMVNPLDLPLLGFLEQKSGKPILAYLVKESEVIEKIESEYSQGLAVEVTEALKESAFTTHVKTIQAHEIGQIIKEAPVAKIVSTILEYAVKSRASDVHIEPQQLHTRIRYRIDGILQEKLALPRTVHDAVVSRIKILCDMKIDERRIAQDGRFNYKMGTDEADLRVSTLPTVHGEKIVIRLLKRSGGIPTLAELGMRGSALKSLEIAITRPQGIILLTGPTGSGKTTTLYSVLTRLNTPRVNIVTLEDPVEYELIGTNQVQVNPTGGLTFASGLRAFLRQDPNIILVGEIRDTETTSLAIQAALTGHLVLSTLHTSSAATAIPRLLDLGAEPFLIVSVLTAVGAQRIVRRICLSCKTSYIPPPDIQRDFALTLGPLLADSGKKELTLYKGNGCAQCNNTGYLGRIGMFEIFILSQAISKLILGRSTAEDIERQAKEEGLVTLKQDGFMKTLEGITTLEEVLRVVQE